MNRFFVYPSINLEELLSDSELTVEDGVISLKDSESSIEIVDSSLNLDTVDVSGGIATLKHLAEKYGYLMIAADMLYKTGDVFFEAYQSSVLNEEALYDADNVFTDFATLEMLNFSEEYGWSKSFYNRLVKLRKQTRTALDVKNEYKVGDEVSFLYCGVNAASVMSGQVIFADKHHVIVHISCYTLQLAADINRNTMSPEDVEAIVGKPISEIKENEHDRFIDMYNPLVFVPYNIFHS